MRRDIREGGAAVWVVAIVLSIVILVVVIIGVGFNPYAHDFAYTLSGTHGNVTGEDVMMENRLLTRHVLSYVLFFSDLPQGYFTFDEVDHLVDVRRLVYGSLLVSLASILVLLFFPRSVWMRARIRTGYILLVVSGLFMLTSLVNIEQFRRAFLAFHVVFFPMGNYAFSAESALIQTYPPSFFYALVALIFLGILGVAVALVMVRKWSRSDENLS